MVVPYMPERLWSVCCSCDSCLVWYDRGYNVQGCGMSQEAMCGSVATVTHEIVYL